MRLFLTSSLIVCLFPLALSAQNDLLQTDDELLNRLDGQLQAVEERTRGLQIITGADESAGDGASEGGLTNLAEIKQGTNASVVLDDGKVVVSDDLEINIRIQFEFDSAAISASEQPALSQMCRVMQRAENVGLFQIVGHTDSAGSDDYNQRLSQLRAEEVKRYLVNDCGIQSTRLQAVGYGEEFPDNETDTRAPENRRVELQVLG